MPDDVSTNDTSTSKVEAVSSKRADVSVSCAMAGPGRERVTYS